MLGGACLRAVRLPTRWAGTHIILANHPNIFSAYGTVVVRSTLPDYQYKVPYGTNWLYRIYIAHRPE